MDEKANIFWPEAPISIILTFLEPPVAKAFLDAKNIEHHENFRFSY